MEDTAKTRRRRITKIKTAPSKLNLNPQLDKVRSKSAAWHPGQNPHTIFGFGFYFGWCHQRIGSSQHI